MKYIISIAFFISFLLSAYARDEDIGVLATVNGVPVTLSDVLELSASGEAQLPLIYKGDELEKAVLKLRKELLEVVIDRKLVYEDFKNHDFKLPRDFVENNMDQILKSFNLNTRQELESMLRERGKTLDEFKVKAYENLAVQILIYSQCYKEVFITPQDVFMYYESHKADFTSNAAVKLRVLTLKKKGAHEQDAIPLSRYLEKKLKGGDDNVFVDAVSLYSDGPNLEHGGELNWINVADLRKEFAELITEYRKGSAYGPINTDDAIYFFIIKDYKDSRSTSFAEVKDDIRKKMTEEAKMQAYKDYVNTLRKQALIQYYI